MGQLALLIAVVDEAGLRHPPADGEMALEPLAERHRAALRAACAEDGEIWAIYASDWGPDGFDASFDAMLAGNDRIGFVITAGGAIAGMTAWLGLDHARQVVEIGSSYLRPALRGTGLNRRVKRLMLAHAFASGIRRVEFRVDDRNACSKAAVARIGGIREGLLRADRVTWTGHVRDTVLFSILAEEWR